MGVLEEAVELLAKRMSSSLVDRLRDQLKPLVKFGELMARPIGKTAELKTCDDVTDEEKAQVVAEFLDQKIEKEIEKRDLHWRDCLNYVIEHGIPRIEQDKKKRTLRDPPEPKRETGYNAVQLLEVEQTALVGAILGIAADAAAIDDPATFAADLPIGNRALEAVKCLAALSRVGAALSILVEDNFISLTIHPPVETDPNEYMVVLHGPAGVVKEIGKEFVGHNLEEVLTKVVSEIHDNQDAEKE